MDSDQLNDDLFVRPGTYFNPRTETLVIVDDSPELNAEIFNIEAFEGTDLVQISEEVPVDIEQRDRLLEEFQTSYRLAGVEAISATAAEQSAEDVDPDLIHEVGRE